MTEGDRRGGQRERRAGQAKASEMTGENVGNDRFEFLRE